MSVAEAPSFQPARVSPVTRSGRAIVGRSVELEAISAALDEGLESLAGLLRPGGRLAVWASAPDLEFERRLRDRFAVVRTVTVDVARGPADVIYVGLLAEADGG